MKIRAEQSSIELKTNNRLVAVQNSATLKEDHRGKGSRKTYIPFGIFFHGRIFESDFLGKRAIRVAHQRKDVVDLLRVNLESTCLKKGFASTGKKEYEVVKNFE